MPTAILAEASYFFVSSELKACEKGEKCCGNSCASNKKSKTPLDKEDRTRKIQDLFLFND